MNETAEITIKIPPQPRRRSHFGNVKLRPYVLWLPDVDDPAFDEAMRRSAESAVAALKNSKEEQEVMRWCEAAAAESLRQRAVKRGEIWTAVFSGDYGKPRPALVVQSNRVKRDYPSVALCPITSELVEGNQFRVIIEPTETTGLRKPSQVMVDKITALPKTKVRERIGKLEDWELAEVHETLLLLIGARDPV